MLVVEPPSSPTMMGYTQQLTAFLLEGTKEKSMVSSFHHSDTSWDFNFDSFSDVPVYDEATTPTTPPPTSRTSISKKEKASSTSCYAERLPWEEVTKKNKKKDRKRELDFNSSWPSARHLFAKANNNNSNNNSSSHNKTSSSNNNNTLDNNSSHHHPSRQSVAPSASQQSTPSNRVRFAPTKVVRTHSLVLGDHPMCEDGLALQLGWDYEESKDILTPHHYKYNNNSNHHHHAEWNVPRWRRLLRPTGPTNHGPAKLLSLQERKKLLKEVAGCTEAELEKRRFCARFLLDYAFYEPPESPPKQKKQARQVVQQQQQQQQSIPNRTINTQNKSFTNTKNFGSKNSNGGRRGGSNGCRDPPPPTNHETPIARPRRRSMARRSSHQPNFAARMA